MHYHRPCVVLSVDSAVLNLRHVSAFQRCRIKFDYHLFNNITPPNITACDNGFSDGAVIKMQNNVTPCFFDVNVNNRASVVESAESLLRLNRKEGRRILRIQFNHRSRPRHLVRKMKAQNRAP